MMSRVKVKKPLNINYIDLFSKEWVKILNPLLSSDYMFNLMAFLQEIYEVIPNSFEGREFIHPKKDDIFDNFRSSPYESLRVVIIGKEPYTTKNATGIPFSIPLITDDDAKIEPELDAIQKYVHQNISKNFDKEGNPLFDETFFQWTYQGVLLLDAASTSEEGTEMAHAPYWRNFTREVVKILDKENDDLIFMLWGKEAKYFEKFINKKNHYVLYSEHPKESIKLNKDWDGSCLEECNKLLEQMGPKDSRIYW